MTCMECEFHLKETLPWSDQFTQFLNCVQWRAVGSATLLANMISRGVRNIPNCVCSHMYVSVCECVCLHRVWVSIEEQQLAKPVLMNLSGSDTTFWHFCGLLKHELASHFVEYSLTTK